MFVIIGWVVVPWIASSACSLLHGGNMGPIIKALPLEMMAMIGGADAWAPSW